MGVFNSIKGIFSKEEIYVKDADTAPLVVAQEQLKEAHSSLSKFLQEVKDFQPARRHLQLYNERVVGKIALVRAWLGKGVYFLEDKANNKSSSVEGIKGTTHLADMLVTWAKVLKHDEPPKQRDDYSPSEVYTTYAGARKPGVVAEEAPPADVLGILRVEMWGNDRIKRGFPAPENKETLFIYLENSVKKIKEAKRILDEYNSTVF